MTLVLEPNIHIKDHIHPHEQSILIDNNRSYNNGTNFFSQSLERSSSFDTGQIYDILHFKICLLINNEPCKIPVWGINSLSRKLNKYTDEEISFMYFCLSRFNDSLFKVDHSDIRTVKSSGLDPGTLSSDTDDIIGQIIEHYCYCRSFVSWKFYSLNCPSNVKILRFYSTIENFNSLYRRYGSYDLSDSFEFDLSTQELDNSKQGSWILRKSSLSRLTNIPESQRKEALDTIKKYLIEFYALSWKKISGIYHVRFIFVPWKGWCVLRDPNSFDLSVIPPLFKGKWFVCFIDCLEYLLARHNLNFHT